MNALDAYVHRYIGETPTDNYTLELYQIKQVSGFLNFLPKCPPNDFLASTSGGKEPTTCPSLELEAFRLAQSESRTSISP